MLDTPQGAAHFGTLHAIARRRDHASFHPEAALQEQVDRSELLVHADVDPELLGHELGVAGRETDVARGHGG